jgi:hypothetical protein
VPGCLRLPQVLAAASVAVTVVVGETSHEAMILWAMIALMARRLAKTSDLSNSHLEYRLGYDLPRCEERLHGNRAWA